MTDSETILSERAAELRRAFDRSFAEPAQAARPETSSFVGIRAGGKSYAVRAGDIAGLFSGVVITPCPSPVAELRGIAGFRGALTPVYDLASLLGLPASQGQWVVLAAGRGLAFAFDAFDGHFQIEPHAVAAQPDPSATRYVRESVRVDGREWPVIDIPSVAAAIEARAAALTSHKEH